MDAARGDKPAAIEAVDADDGEQRDEFGDHENACALRRISIAWVGGDGRRGIRRLGRRRPHRRTSFGNRENQPGVKIVAQEGVTRSEPDGAKRAAARHGGSGPASDRDVTGAVLSPLRGGISMRLASRTIVTAMFLALAGAAAAGPFDDAGA